MKILTPIGLGLTLLLQVFPALAQELPAAVRTSTAPYTKYLMVTVPALSVPTVVEAPITDCISASADFALLNQTNAAFEPVLFVQQSNTLQFSVTADSADGSVASMIDQRSDTYTEFPLPPDARGRTRITLTSSQPVTSSALRFTLDAFVALPTSIEIRVVDESNQEKILVAKKEIESTEIRYPKTTAATWIVTFTYGQPLRITELRLQEDNPLVMSKRSVRFLAQPAMSYRLYCDSDRPARITVGEAGNLRSDEGVRAVTVSRAENNPDYVIADTDADSVPDIRDNCVQTSNADQKDIDQNGRGDACDDFDKDGIINTKDNCQDLPNAGQADTDSDGIGDVCDSEESRITERNAWLPWAGMGLAAAVLITLATVTMKRKVP